MADVELEGVVRTEKVMEGQCVIRMECEMCQEWFHILCEGVLQKDYKKVTEMGDLI